MKSFFRNGFLFCSFFLFLQPFHSEIERHSYDVSYYNNGGLGAETDHTVVDIAYDQTHSFP